ncbi:hypothetical protein LCGC14_1475140 [marine sediment metagenome]|uniref:CARDB domain-containing protein n=1 Tax=marine sediment metagenome TaxID=412755 RepID=A0A0F9JX49_9ZZZZ
MFNRKKSIKIATLFLIGLFFFSGISTATSTSITEASNENTTIIEESNEPEGEDFTEPSYVTTETEWRPIEESLGFNSNTEESSDPTATAFYEASSKIERIVSSQEATSQYDETIPSVIEPYEGLMASEDFQEKIKGTDDRTRITPTTSYPWRTIVKLYVTAADSSTWIGSGAMIDSFHVLTAGHIAYMPANGGWVTSIRVVPAMDNLADPYGEAWMTTMRSYTGWTISQNHGHDWAVLTIDRNVGSYTGWMGRMTAGSGNSIYTQTINTAGYPGDLDSGNNMYFDANTGAGATSLNHYYWVDTMGGQSGSPVWRYVSGNRYILTVHAYGRDDPLSNYGTRLNSDKYNRINTWLSADAGSAPSDKADLEDRGLSYSGYTPGTVTPGVTSFTVWSDVRNRGTASSGGFYIYYYASINTFISPIDYFLGSDYISSISPFNYRDSSWTGVFPASVPAGNYYIGWIIDSPDWVDEFDEINNKAYETSQITVNPPPPPPSGYIEVQINDSVTSDPVNFAYIKIWDDTNALIRTAFTNGTGFYNFTAIDVGTYNVTVSKVGYHTQKQLQTITGSVDAYHLDFDFVAYPPDSGYIEVRVNETRRNYAIENAYVRVFNNTSGEFFGSGYTDSSGFYNVTGLYIGMWTVIVTYPGFYENTKLDYINWNGDDDYLYYYLDVRFQPINGSVALFRDNLPWNVNSTEPILVKYNISYTVYNSSDFGSVDLSQYQKVILASEQVQTFYDRLEGNVTWFEDYAANGGILELHSVDRKGNYHDGTWNAYLYPGGINKTYNVEFVDNSINIQTHPFLLKPFKLNESQVDGYIGGVFTVYPSHARKVLLGPTSDPIFIEFSYGSGYIVASTHTLEWNANYGGTQQLYENLILYDPLNFHYSINVTTPIGSSEYEVNQSYHLTWDTTDNIAEVKIDLYRGGVFVMEIVANTTNDGDFLWSVPDLIDSTQYQIKVMDVAYTLTFDYSEMFEIFNPSISVTNPIGTSIWNTGASEYINWTSRGTITSVKIELFLGGAFELEISPTTDNDGVYLWVLPSNLTISSEYSIKITDASTSVTYDFSVNFEIRSPPSSAIPGYDLLILSGLLVSVSIYLIIRKRKKLSIQDG